MAWYDMVFTHLGSVHARQADVDRLSFQPCIVKGLILVRRYWFRIIFVGAGK
jgi:hypothetical protein